MRLECNLFYAPRSMQSRRDLTLARPLALAIEK